jgi:hypothetical protein
MAKYFIDWAAHFACNVWGAGPEMGWDSAPHLTEAELRLVGPSLRQFQLGENAEGRTLKARASEYCTANGIAHLTESTQLFIKEEQRHSAILGRFLLREGVVLLEKDPVDGAFRWLRKLAGFELAVTVLSSAECLAVPYYAAVRDATGSELLQRICTGILRDEARHLCYQGQVLALFSRERGFWRESVTRTLHRLLVLAAGCVVYAQHRQLFRAVAMPVEEVLGRAFEALSQIERQIGSRVLVGLGWMAVRSSNAGPVGRTADR